MSLKLAMNVKLWQLLNLKLDPIWEANKDTIAMLHVKIIFTIMSVF